MVVNNVILFDKVRNSEILIVFLLDFVNIEIINVNDVYIIVGNYDKI